MLVYKCNTRTPPFQSLHSYQGLAAPSCGEM